MKQLSLYLVYLFVGLLLLNLLVVGVKEVVKRPRPTTILTDYSFPSAHTANAFFIAHYLVVGSFMFRKRKKNRNISSFILLIGLYLSAVLVGLSRLYYNVHYLSDVVAGGIIGYLISQILLNNFKKYAFCPKTAKKSNQGSKKR